MIKRPGPHPIAAAGGVVLLIGALIVGERAYSRDWASLTEADGPAKLRFLTFSNGSTLSELQSVRVGSWSISFDSSSPPIAEVKIDQIHGDYSHSSTNIIIRNLNCENAVLGSGHCLLEMEAITPGDFARICMVLGDGKPLSAHFDIECPTSIELE